MIMEKEQQQSPPLLSAPTVEIDGNFFQQHILVELLIVSWIICLWELYLNFRQRRLIQKLVRMPPILDNILTEDVYDKSRVYALDTNTFGIVQEIYSSILNTVFVLCWGLYYCWEWGKDLVSLVGLDPNNEFYATAGCVTVMKIYSMILSDLPFTIYSTFVLEQKHNFNNQTPLFFVKDQIKKFVVSHILTVPLICGMIWIIKNGGDYFVFYLWIFSVIISLLLMIIYPEFIAPLFDNYSPLPEGELKERIEALASSLNYPLYKLYIVEGSVRSSHSNAYLYGFYKHKRIVLFDTLVAEYQRKKDEEKEKEKEKEKSENQNSNENVVEEKKEEKKKEIRGCETDEIIAVLGHELGHWHHSHTLKGFLYGQVIFLLNFILFAQLLHYTPIYEAFGFVESKPILIGLIVILSHVLEPFNKLLGWAMTVNSRRYEFEADRFAMNLGHAEPLKRALIKLHKDNLGYPLYDNLYSNWHHSHPPLLERLDALKKED